MCSFLHIDHSSHFKGTFSFCVSVNISNEKIINFYKKKIFIQKSTCGFIIKTFIYIKV